MKTISDELYNELVTFLENLSTSLLTTSSPFAEQIAMQAMDLQDKLELAEDP